MVCVDRRAVHIDTICGFPPAAALSNIESSAPRRRISELEGITVMGTTSGYWHMWHLFSSGVVYCALGMPNIECTGARWRSLQPHLPMRDRYAQSKLLQATIAYMEIRGEIAVPPGADRMRLLYSRYLPWSARPRTAQPGQRPSRPAEPSRQPSASVASAAVA